MQKSEIRVLIVDDDLTFGRGICEVVKRMGFQPIHALNGTEALNQFRVQGAQFIIIDCLLPKIPGVDLAAQLREAGAEKTPIVLMSGIHKDKTFIKDAIHKSKAIQFLTKPFDISELQNLISSNLSGIVDEEIQPAEVLLSSFTSPGEKIALVNRLGQIDAYDIPWLSMLLMSSNASGVLKLESKSGIAAIAFAGGAINQVEMKNPRSFFGALLVEHGYLTSDQVEKALQIDSPKRVGERLVELNFLSPHVINFINGEQSAIRLSALINDESYLVTFGEAEMEKSEASIDVETLAPFLVDWLDSKIPLSWLQQRYMKWLNCPAAKSKKTTIQHRIWTLEPLKSNAAIVNAFENGQSVAQVLATGHSEEIVYKVFQLLVWTESITLKLESRPVDETYQLERLQKIQKNLEIQDFFAMFGLKRSARAPEVKKIYHDYAKIFHPDRLPSNASSNLKDVARAVFEQFTKAYNVLNDDTKRTEYLKEIEKGQAEKILQAENLLEEGRQHIKTGQYAKAREKLDHAIKLRPPTSDLLIHLAWARLAGLDSEKATASKDLREIESMLGKIPPEDRHNATYYFVKGLFLKTTGDNATAKKNIQHALSLNPKFIEAERLLRVLDLKDTGKNTSILHADLKDVVGSLFRKK